MIVVVVEVVVAVEVVVVVSSTSAAGAFEFNVISPVEAFGGPNVLKPTCVTSFMDSS